MKDARLLEIEDDLKDRKTKIDFHAYAWRMIEDLAKIVGAKTYARICDEWIKSFYYKKEMFLDWIEYGQENGQTVYLHKDNCKEDLRKAYAGGELTVYMF